MIRLEFHCHTLYSKDSLVKPEKLLAACQRKGIDRVVITDHNTIAGARYAQRLDPQRVIVGEEILTTRGELLAAYVVEEIPPRLEPLETIRLLRQQGAFISVSHPYDRLRHGWQLPDLLEIAPFVDAIETYNARCLRAITNQKAQEFAQEHHLPGTVGSDAHTVFELGTATLLLPDFNNADELRQAMQQARQETHSSSIWVRFASKYASWSKKLSGKKPAGE